MKARNVVVTVEVKDPDRPDSLLVEVIFSDLANIERPSIGNLYYPEHPEESNYLTWYPFTVDKKAVCAFAAETLRGTPRVELRPYQADALAQIKKGVEKIGYHQVPAERIGMFLSWHTPSHQPDARLIVSFAFEPGTRARGERAGVGDRWRRDVETKSGRITYYEWTMR